VISREKGESVSSGGIVFQDLIQIESGVFGGWIDPERMFEMIDGFFDIAFVPAHHTQGMRCSL
jgi:hypothetical protein